jgi:NAD-dependent DNA ligase
VDEAITCIHEFEKKRPKLPYMTDGMVMKVSDFAQRVRLGATSKAPRWVIAYKYETEQQPTVLKDVRWQVGKSGKLTPVADVDPVFIGGVTVTHATLHNIDQIRRLDVHRDDTIVIERAGEVIPYVLEVIREKRPKTARVVEPPSVCPSCRSPVEQDEGTPEIRCPNPDCPAQLRERLIWFAGRTQMDLDGLGEKIIEQLVERGYVRTYADFFRLTTDQLATLTRETRIAKGRAENIATKLATAQSRWSELKESEEYLELRGDLQAKLRWLVDQLNISGLTDELVRQLIGSGALKRPDDLFSISAAEFGRLTQLVKVGDKTAAKIIKSIESAKSRGLSRVLASLGIRLVGATAARKFGEWAGDVHKLVEASVEELAGVLAKDPEAKNAGLKVERRLIDELYHALHPVGGRGLFDGVRENQPARDGLTEEFLRKREASLTRSSRLGASRIRRLAECFPSLDELKAARADTLLDCILAGVAVARSLYDYLHSERGTAIIRGLAQVGVSLTEESTKRERSEWSGKTVVVTGSFDGYGRSDIEKRLRALGATVTSAVSSKTHAVFVGKDPGAAKTNAAQAHGIRTYDEETVHRLMKS